MDSYDSVSEILDAAQFDLWDLIEFLIEEGHINEDTMPHIFEDDLMENEDNYDD